MSYTVTRLTVPPTDAPAGQHTWPLRVEVTGSHEGFGPKVFVYHAALKDDFFKGDTFECVASVSQMLEVPEDAAVAALPDGGIVNMYRLASVEVFCHSAVEADELWAKIQEDIEDLTLNISSAGTLEPSEVVTFPTS